jgi:uncharacterized protein (DUF433 family)
MLPNHGTPDPNPAQCLPPRPVQSSAATRYAGNSPYEDMAYRDGTGGTAMLVVERELYTVSEAARILRVPKTTLRWWLEGRAPDHKPVLRPEPTGSGNVTWGEFIEAGFLREYRQHRVPLQRLRPFIDALRDGAGVPYPLSHKKPLVLDRNLVLVAQREAGLDAYPAIYEDARTGQHIFAPAIAQYIEQIDFAPEGEPWALRLHPAGRRSPVVIDPEYGSGAPTVKGIRTEALVELLEAGDVAEEIACDYALSVADVYAAASYEWSDGAAAAA